MALSLCVGPTGYRRDHGNGHDKEKGNGRNVVLQIMSDWMV